METEPLILTYLRQCPARTSGEDRREGAESELRTGADDGTTEVLDLINAAYYIRGVPVEHISEIVCGCANTQSRITASDDILGDTSNEDTDASPKVYVGHVIAHEAPADKNPLPITLHGTELHNAGPEIRALNN